VFSFSRPTMRLRKLSPAAVTVFARLLCKNLCKNGRLSALPAYDSPNHEFAQFTWEDSVELTCEDKQTNRDNLNFKSAACVSYQVNSQNSTANAQKTVSTEYVPPMSLHRFCQIIGLSKASAWRYEKRGWLRTHLIANRRYVLAVDVAEFNRRLASR
jgi:hypothetical protein